MKTTDKNKKYLKRVRRHGRIRSKVVGTAEQPRLSVFKSNRYLYAQIINDEACRTLAAASTKDISKGTMLEKAKLLGKAIAEKAIKNKLNKVSFDRGGNLYTGRIKAVADGAREAGLKF